MSCEDCKNYEKKENVTPDADLRDLMKAMRKVCYCKECRKCDLGNTESDCNLGKLRRQM